MRESCIKRVIYQNISLDAVGLFLVNPFIWWLGACRTSFHPICAREARHRMEIWGKLGCDDVSSFLLLILDHCYYNYSIILLIL